jgi:hypothetical protein
VPFEHRVPRFQRPASAILIESSPRNHLPVPEHGTVAELGPTILMFVHVHE